MSRPNLLKELSSRPLLCDGGMGTQLIARGLRSGECSERWNAEHPELVRAVHAEYLAAGCEMVTTNTFGATRASLARHGLTDRVAELNLAGARVAREAAGERAWVLGDIGPFGGFLEPIGDALPEDVRMMFLEQARALREGGCDAAIVETMSDPEELTLAVQAAKQAGDWPVIATYAFAKTAAGEFRTMTGATAADAVQAAIAAGADLVGANCGTSMALEDYVRLAGELVAAAGATPVILQPNAGSPQTVGEKLVYGATPDDLAAVVPALRQAGVRIIGGCCGTTPAHLRRMGEVLRAG